MIHNHNIQGSATLPMMRAAAGILIALALVMMGVGRANADDDESDLAELQSIYLEVKADHDKYLAILDEPDAHSEQDVTFARDRISTLKTSLQQIRREISGLGGNVDGAPKIVVKPGGRVTAEVPDTDASTTRLTATHCDPAKNFKRPNTSTYRLPPREAQSGTQNALKVQLLATENALVDHSMECRENWTRQLAVEWAAVREALVAKLLRLEIEYAMSFASGFTDDENVMVAEAYENSPRLRELTAQESKLYDKFIDLKIRLEDAGARYLISDAVTQLRIEQLRYETERARTAWRAVANELYDLRGPQVEMLRRVQLARAARGLGVMRANNADLEFEFHQKSDFLRTDSAVLIKILGSAGIRILERESGRQVR